MRGFVENVFFLFRAQAAENPYLFFLPQYENIIYSREKVTRSKIILPRCRSYY